jgi:uncharacterized protein
VTQFADTVGQQAFRQLLPMIDDRLLHLIVMPTERCNFRCTYCPQTFNYGKMDDSVVRGLKNLISLRVPALDSLQLAWFGGEPLLAAATVLDISEHAKHVAGQQQNMRFEGSMTTNAFLLTGPLCSKLVNAGVTQFNISLDGLNDVHDRSRHLAGGRPSFETIWQNLVTFRESDLSAQICLELHMDSDNKDTFTEFIRAVASTFLSDSRFSYVFRPIERLGGPNDHTLPILNPHEVEELVLKATREIPTDKRIEPKEEASSCYAAHANSFVVRSNGRLGKCSLALEDERNTVGSLLSDGSMRLDPAKVKPWLRGLKSLDSEALACPLKGLPS